MKQNNVNYANYIKYNIKNIQQEQILPVVYGSFIAPKNALVYITLNIIFKIKFRNFL